MSQHNFQEYLDKSHEIEKMPFWDDVYKQLFPGFLLQAAHPDDGPHQRSGIDRTVLMRNSEQVLVDEKVRARNKNGEVYDDILIEAWSDEKRRVRGWTFKELKCDYIAYAIAPLGICYLIKFDKLKETCIENYIEWSKEYGFRYAKNTSWVTTNIPIPVSVLEDQIGKIKTATFEPFEP